MGKFPSFWHPGIWHCCFVNIIYAKYLLLTSSPLRALFLAPRIAPLVSPGQPTLKRQMSVDFAFSSPLPPQPFNLAGIFESLILHLTSFLRIHNRCLVRKKAKRALLGKNLVEFPSQHDKNEIRRRCNSQRNFPSPTVCHS